MLTPTNRLNHTLLITFFEWGCVGVIDGSGTHVPTFVSIDHMAFSEIGNGLFHKNLWHPLWF